MPNDHDQLYLDQAIAVARQSFRDGYLPIGSALVVTGRIMALARNERCQKNDPTAHAEMVCLRQAGRLTPLQYRAATLYTTLSPCWMCAGAILLYRIPRVVIGENENFQGPEKVLLERGVELVHMNSRMCVEIMAEFIRKNPKLWNEDIGELS